MTEDLSIYECYIDGKMIKRTRTKECLELVHTNMYGAFGVHAWGEYGYLITFSDDYSRFGDKRSDALDTFIELKAKSDIYTKSLWLDQGDMSSKFDSFHWSTRLFPSHVHQGLHYYKMERWNEDIKLGWT